MKSSSSMIFFKRAGVILMIFALSATSCNKYADDFKQLNTKLDALATQVAGVTTLTTDMTALKASVATLQTAIAALPTTASITALSTSLAGIVTKVDALTATLKTVADNGTATKAVVDGLKTDLTALSAKIVADDKVITDAIAALAATDVTQNAALTALKDQNTALAAAIANVQTKLTSSSDATAASIAALQVLLNAQKVQLDQIILNTSMYNGDVTITTDAEVTFFLAKIAQLGIINGNLTVSKSAISAGQLANVDLITSKIMNVIGTGIVTLNFKQGDALNLSKLVSAKGNVTITGTAKGAGADIDISSLSSVGGNLILDYDGPYASAALKNVAGNLTLVRKAVVAATTPLGTTSINIPDVTVTGTVSDGVNPAGTLVFPLATEIKLSGNITSLTADKATSIKLNTKNYAGALTLTSSLTAAATIDLSEASNITGAAAISGFGATTINLAGLVTAPGGLTVTTGATGTVDLTKYNEPAGLTVTGPKTLVLPAMVAGPITSTTAENVTLAKHECAATPTIPAVKNLVLGALNSTLAFGVYTQLVTADISGKAQSTWAATLAVFTDRLVGNPDLTTLKLGGNIRQAEINLCPKLTSLTTAGNVNTLFVGNNNILESMNLGHNAYMGSNGANGGPGSDLSVVQNPKLKSLISSTDYPAAINIGDNPELSILDLSSYKTPLLAAPAATTSIDIHGNNLSGDYINAVGITPTTPYRETVIKQAGLATLKTLIAKYPDAPNLPNLNMQISAEHFTLNGGGVEAALNARIWGDAFHTILKGATFEFAWPAVGLVTKQEFALVQ